MWINNVYPSLQIYKYNMTILISSSYSRLKRFLIVKIIICSLFALFKAYILYLAQCIIRINKKLPIYRAIIDFFRGSSKACEDKSFNFYDFLFVQYFLYLFVNEKD